MGLGRVTKIHHTGGGFGPLAILRLFPSWPLEGFAQTFRRGSQLALPESGQGINGH